MHPSDAIVAIGMTFPCSRPERIDREFTAISRCRARLRDLLAVLLDSARSEMLARLGWRRIRVEEAG